VAVLRWLLIAAVALWVWLLRGFVHWQTLLVLSVFGPLLLVGGVALARAIGPRLLVPGWHHGLFLVGLGMIGGALATLSPAAPAELLVTTASGWDRLDERLGRLTAAMYARDVALVRRLASRGLGDAEPLDFGGRPVIHGATDAGVLTALLDSGFAPDARDEDGRTLLMQARHPDLVRVLLAAGADVDARDREGRTVADSLPDELRALVEAHAGRALQQREDEDPSRRGRTDWLTVARDPSAAGEQSTVTLDPPDVGRDETATIAATLVNPSADDRLLDVSATLGVAALFVGASHDGVIARPGRPQLVQAVRWPLLSLPAHSRGRLELRIVTRPDIEAGDLGVEWQVRTLPGAEVERLQISQPLSDPAPDADGTDRTWIYAGGAAALAAVAWLLHRMRTMRRNAGDGTEGAASLIAAAVALVLGFAVALFLWSMAEPWARFERTECTILDHRVRLFRSLVNRSTPALVSNATPTGSSPLAAVRIERGAAPVITTGFDTGFMASSVQDLRRFPLGARVPCWVDPASASRFTLTRLPSLSSGLALGTFTLLALVLMAISRGLRPDGPASPRQRRQRKRRGETGNR